jgi:hypothetical protein
MKIDEIDKLVNDPNQQLSQHQMKILRDVLLLMKLNNLTDSADIDPAEMVAVIQKEKVS